MDVASAEWITARLASDRTIVGYVVPAGFEYCVRCLHPARDQTNSSLRPSEAVVSVGDLTAIMPTPKNTDPTGPTNPRQESLSPKQFGELMNVLEPNPVLVTALHWTGYAHIRSTSPTVEAVIQGETYASSKSMSDEYRTWYEGSALFGDSVQGPNYVWPPDRSWIIVSDIDLFTTYVATHTPITGVLARTSLDYSIVKLTDPLL